MWYLCAAAVCTALLYVVKGRQNKEQPAPKSCLEAVYEEPRSHKLRIHLQLSRNPLNPHRRSRLVCRQNTLPTSRQRLGRGGQGILLLVCERREVMQCCPMGRVRAGGCSLLRCSIFGCRPLPLEQEQQDASCHDAWYTRDHGVRHPELSIWLRGLLCCTHTQRAWCALRLRLTACIQAHSPTSPASRLFSFCSLQTHGHPSQFPIAIFGSALSLRVHGPDGPSDTAREGTPSA